MQGMNGYDWYLFHGSGQVMIFHVTRIQWCLLLLSSASRSHAALLNMQLISNSMFFLVSKELQNSGKDPKSSMVEMALASNVWTGFNQGLLERHRLLPPIASFCLLYQAVPDGSLVSPWKSLLRVTFVPKSDLGSKLCFGICRERKHMAPACRCADAKPDAQRCERYRQRQIRINILYK